MHITPENKAVAWLLGTAALLLFVDPALKVFLVLSELISSSKILSAIWGLLVGAVAVALYNSLPQDETEEKLSGKQE
ncbi:hypothetical protein CYMTET_45594 [Cymbomonas tetramitiformis]|uniref:Uncharacterized protein n=1 Tax=Cymbomonas tetramitiformis TaxID=36881 RepID=A0AAE0EYG3_9CHLO|nr:hypothetical protein CYMTET_45594 [Cymbomonas tetramitiformis]